MRRLRAFRFAVAGLFAAWLTVCAIAGIFAVNSALHPPRRQLTFGDEAVASQVALRSDAVLQQVSITAADRSELRAWFIRKNAGNSNVVILLHGQADNRAGMLGPAEMLIRHGYSVLLPDARGSGESGGSLVTYGLKETEDVRRWINWLNTLQHPKCIFGLGDSMGAAELLQSLNEVRQFCAVVAESPFASFREASYERIGQWTGTGPWLGRTLLRPVVWFGFAYAHLHYGTDLAGSRPDKAVEASEIPVMLIHGLSDDNLLPRNSEEILRAAQTRNRNVILWEPPDAGHCGASGAEPIQYEQRVIGWFADHDHLPWH